MLNVKSNVLELEKKIQDSETIGQCSFTPDFLVAIAIILCM